MMRKGFTMIELLVVMAIIAILLGIVRPSLTASAARAREFECESHLRQIGAAMRAYTEDFGAFPQKLEAVDTILQDRDLLVCPGTSKAYVYHRPKGEAAGDEIVVSCVDLHGKTKSPHRYGEGCLVLTSSGKVRRILH